MSLDVSSVYSQMNIPFNVGLFSNISYSSNKGIFSTETDQGDVVIFYSRLTQTNQSKNNLNMLTGG
ncbi:hypothetical protein CI610_03341 [invertebrate metagenome]|uniref:Uncharacterized protein n=1 Tax=invertebrate metagenome TaxID=1711999 RepID=A0A2H9T3F3_9ZZZZ